MHSAFGDFRFIFGLIGGAIIALALFTFMHWLIQGRQSVQSVQPDINLVGFVHVQKQPQVQHKTRIKPPPPPPQKPPPETQVTTQVSKQVQTQHLAVNVNFDPSSLGTGVGVFISPQNNGPATNAGGYAPLTPMVRISPIYPPRAQMQNVEGVIETCFTVNPDGSVANAHIKHASSPQARRMLGQAALKTIRQYKFFPKKVNGKPVPGTACQAINFDLNN